MNLKILCLSRNNIKNLNGLEAIGGSLGEKLILGHIEPAWYWFGLKIIFLHFSVQVRFDFIFRKEQPARFDQNRDTISHVKHLAELWISYNNIEKLRGIHVLKELKVLIISHNNIKVSPCW